MPSPKHPSLPALKIASDDDLDWIHATGSAVSPSSQAIASVRAIEPPMIIEDGLPKSSENKIQNSLSRMREKRSELNARRVHALEERVQLRFIRDNTIDLDAQFTKALTAFASKTLTPEAKALVELSERVQSAKTNYLSREDDYNLLESALNQGEWELKELETRLYRQLEHYPHASSFPAFPDISPLGMDETLPSSTASTVSDRPSYPPLLREYLSRLGDADLILEQLTELRNVRAQLVEQQRTLGSVGRDLDQSGLQFLADFDKNHEQQQRQLSEVNMDVENLRIQCQREDLLPDKVDDNSNEDQLVLRDDQPFAPDPLLVERVFSIPDVGVSALPRSGFDKTAGEPPALHNLRQKTRSDVLGYINDWFLWRLQRSSLEVKRYKSAPELDKLRGNEPYLSNLILEHWHKDSASDLLSGLGKIPKSVTKSNFGSSRAARSDSPMPGLERLTIRPLQNQRRAQKTLSLRAGDPVRRRSSEPDIRTIVSC